MSVDHRSFSVDGKPPAGGEGFDQNLSRRWWKLEGPEAVQSITACLTFLNQAQQARLNQHIVSARLYGNLSTLGVLGLSTSRLASAHPSLRDRVSYNVVQSALDTCQAKIASHKPRPLFLTSGGDYRQQRTAKKLNKFTEGIFEENEAYYEIGPRAFLDGAIWGDGVVHVFEEDGRAKWERVLGSELWVDEYEAFYGYPRSMHRVKNVDREVMLEAFPNDDDYPDRQKFISDSNPARIDNTSKPALADQVVVRESWHLPDGPDADEENPKGGRHIISVADGVLLDEPWTEPFFPFARFTWSKRPYGYWGQGAAEQIQNLQLEINKLLAVVQRSMHLMGTFKIFVENTSKIVDAHLNNDVGTIVKYSGTTPPIYATPPSVQPEIFQHLWTLTQKAYEQVGISLLSATAQKPQGLNSGVAIREYKDETSDRFLTISNAYDRFFLDLARLSIATVRRITKGRRAYRVKVAGWRAVDEIDWRDVNLSEDSYVLKCYPVSSLPNDPAGRLQTVQEWTQAGLISPRQAKRLLDFPDLEQIESLANAAEEYLQRSLDRIVDEGIMTPPEPFDDLNLAHEMALEYYQQGRIQGLEEERLELLRRYIAQVVSLKQAATPPPAPPVNQPQAAPQPPPQNDLIQNVPGMNGTQAPAAA